MYLCRSISDIPGALVPYLLSTSSSLNNSKLPPFVVPLISTLPILDDAGDRGSLVNISPSILVEMGQPGADDEDDRRVNPKNITGTPLFHDLRSSLSRNSLYSQFNPGTSMQHAYHGQDHSSVCIHEATRGHAAAPGGGILEELDPSFINYGPLAPECKSL